MSGHTSSACQPWLCVVELWLSHVSLTQGEDCQVVLHIVRSHSPYNSFREGVQTSRHYVQTLAANRILASPGGTFYGLSFVMPMPVCAFTPALGMLSVFFPQEKTKHIPDLHKTYSCGQL